MTCTGREVRVKASLYKQISNSSPWQQVVVLYQEYRMEREMIGKTLVLYCRGGKKNGCMNIWQRECFHFSWLIKCVCVCVGGFLLIFACYGCCRCCCCWFCIPVYILFLLLSSPLTAHFHISFGGFLESNMKIMSSSFLLFVTYIQQARVCFLAIFQCQHSLQ